MILNLTLLACVTRTQPADSTEPGPGDSSVDSVLPDDDTSPPTSGVLQFDGERPKNLLIVGIDTLRRDYVGHYGGTGSERTPFLDGLLAEGVSLENYRSCSNSTFPSMSCIEAGSYNIDLGWVPSTASPGAMPSDAPVVASVLREHGYTSWYAGATPFFEDAFGIRGHWDSVFNNSAWLGSQVVENAVDSAQLAMDAGDPWVVQVHLLDPHYPYNHPAEYNLGLEELPEIPYDLTVADGLAAGLAGWDELDPEVQANVAAQIEVYYRGAIAYTDDMVESLFTQLDEMGALEDTLVLLWADHGEQFWEHDEFGHSNSLYGQETWVMGGFWAKNLAPGSFDKPVSHPDMVPTAVQALGLEGSAAWTGTPLDAISDDRVRYSLRPSFEETWQTVEKNDLRLIYRWDGLLELYDVGVDPFETSDLYADGGDARDELVELMRERSQQVDPFVEGASPGL